MIVLCECVEPPRFFSSLLAVVLTVIPSQSGHLNTSQGGWDTGRQDKHPLGWHLPPGGDMPKSYIFPDRGGILWTGWRCSHGLTTLTDHCKSLHEILWKECCQTQAKTLATVCEWHLCSMATWMTNISNLSMTTSTTNTQPYSSHWKKSRKYPTFGYDGWGEKVTTSVFRKKTQTTIWTSTHTTIHVPSQVRSSA